MEGIELKEFRTLNSKHFLQEDKTIKVQIYNENVHYIENDEYKEIDNTLILTNNGYKNKKNNFQVEFDTNNNDNFINISKNDNKLTMYLKDKHSIKTDYKLKRTKKIKNTELINFKKVFNNIDLSYEIHANKLKESIIINKKTTRDKFVFVIKTDLKLKLNKDNTLSAYKNKKEVYHIAKPYMVDANKEISEAVLYDLKKEKEVYELTIKFDNEWVNNADRKYPILIDPTICDSDNVNCLMDTFIYKGDESQTTYNLNHLIVGVSGNTKYRSLLKFNLPVIPASYKLVHAQLNLYAFPVSSGSYEEIPKIAVHRINTDWTEETAKWTNMNNKYYEDLEDYFEASRHIGDNYLEENYANITKAVKDWYNNPETNYGIMLKQYQEKEISTFSPIVFASKDYNNDSNAKPAMIITYKNYNGVTDYFTYSSQQHFFGTSNIANYTGNLTTTFEVANTVGGLLPANLYLVYNTYDVILNHNYGYGLGIKPNLLQFINKTGLTNFPLSYTNDTGTVHYFYYDETEKVYKDEDGLGLKLKLVDNNYIMTDKDGNSSKFISRNNTYYLTEIKDTNGSIIKIEYDSNNRISKVIDASNKEINITYDTNKISFISPYKTTEVNLTNNLITSITSLGNKETITYTNKNLIESIINPNNITIKYEYTNELESKVSKVLEISKEDNIGNYLTFKYNLSDTKIVDRKGIINTYIFNDNGNVVGITNLDETQNLNNAYGKTYSFGNELYNANKMTTDKALVKYVDNLINDSSFENQSYPFTSENTTVSLTRDARTGKYAMKFDVISLSEIRFEHPLEKINTKATFSFYAKGNGEFRVIAESNNRINYYNNKLTNAYQRYQFTVDNTIDNNSLVIYFDNFTGNKFIIDDMQLEYGEVANYYNLVDNSSFQYGTNNWDIDLSGEGVSANVVNVTNNKKALQLHSAPSGNIIIRKIFDISGKEGDTYNLSFWYKNNGIDASGYVGLLKGITWAMVFFYYDDEFIDGTCVPAKFFNVGNSNWQFFSENFTSEASYSKIELRICSFNNANNCWLTNFSLFKDLEEYSYSYDENGNLISAVDLNKSKSTMKYNTNNQLIKTITPMGSNYSFEYDKKIIDRVINSTSPTGINNQIVYDENNNPIKTIISNRKTNSALEYNIPYYIRAIGTNKYLYINDDKTFKVKECDCSYEKFNLILSGNNVKIQNTILNNYYIKNKGNAILLEYGDYDNLFTIIKNDNNSYTIKTNSNNALTINDSGNIILSPYQDDNLNQQFIFEQANYKEVILSSAEYTPDGRFIKSVTDSIDNKTTYDINTTNGLINSLTNPEDIVTNYTYDDKLRITNIQKEEQQVNYQYENNNLAKIIYGTDNYIFNYNEFNRISDIKINDNTLINNYYEEHNGNLSYIKYGNNDEIHYNYDKLDRLKEVIKQNDTYINYYDNLGRLAKINSTNNKYLYEYDFAERLSKYTHNSYTSEYDYNKDNNIITKQELLDSYKYVYNYEYNKDASLTKININNINYNYLYDNLGRVKESNINDIYKTKYKYLTHGYKTSTTVSEVDDNGIIYKYTYDKLGNIKEVYKDNNLVNKYYYDNQSQLIQDDNLVTSITTKYTYDNYGNILSKKDYEYNTDTLIKEDTYSYENSNWQDLLTSFNNEQITYDEIGNPLSIGNKTLTWLNGRELASYNDGTNNITYRYNLDGIRTSKLVNCNETKYYLEGMNIIFEDRNGSMIYYIYNQDELLGFVYNNATYYYHKNILGDVIGILNSNYEEIVTYTYDAYGSIINIIDNSGTNIGEINPFRYRSYYYDIETNLYYLNSRYYNPNTGRFINADGIIAANQDILSNNLYTYVSNNPINNTDSTGEGFFSSVVKTFVETVVQFRTAYAGGVGVASADGPLPFGDVLAAIGLGALTVGIGIYSIGTSITSYETASKPITKTKPKEYQDNDNTVIYRHRGTNIGNLLPTPRDVKFNSGLSFSTLPPTDGKPAFVTTIGAINATGVVKAVKDGATHVSVTPVVGTISDWRIQGTNSVYTQALRTVCRKWDGVIR